MKSSPIGDVPACDANAATDELAAVGGLGQFGAGGNRGGGVSWRNRGSARSELAPPWAITGPTRGACEVGMANPPSGGAAGSSSNWYKYAADFFATQHKFFLLPWRHRYTQFMTQNTMVQCTHQKHAKSILDIFNEAIQNSTALYDYKPRTHERVWWRGLKPSKRASFR